MDYKTNEHPICLKEEIHHVSKKVENQWTFRIDVGKNPSTGKCRQVYRSGFHTKKEAEQAQAAFLIKVQEEGFFTGSNELMESFLPKWLHTVYKHKVAPTTFERTESTVRNHLLPAFAKCKVSSIKTYDVQQFLSSKSNQGLSPATVKVIRNTLNKAFQTAIDWEIIKKNPVERTKSPSIVKKEKETWTPEEAKKFLNICDELRWKVVFR